MESRHPHPPVFALDRRGSFRKRRLVRFPSLVLLTLLCVVVLGRAEDWPQFRGPTGLGYTTEKALPTTWNAATGEHIAWRAALPKSDGAYSSPIIVGDRVIVTCASNQPVTHRVLCFAKADGRALWDTAIEPGPWILTDHRGGYGAPTPCSDGKQIYAVFGSAVIAALNLDGHLVWRQPIEPHAFDVALGSSPILFRDTVILDCDQTGKTSHFLALQTRDGAVRWKAERPAQSFAHSTPVIVQIAGKPQMLVSASNALQGLDPADGHILWSCAAQGDAASPAFAEGLVFSDSGRGGKAVCVDPTGNGDITATHLRWTIPQIPEGLSSAIIVGGRVWRTHSPSILKCFDLATGKIVFAERISGLSPWPSPIATANGLLYFACAGKTVVVKVAAPLEIVATNDLGEEDRASAAVSDGHLFIRGDKTLFCIGPK